MKSIMRINFEFNLLAAKCDLPRQPLEILLIEENWIRPRRWMILHNSFAYDLFGSESRAKIGKSWAGKYSEIAFCATILLLGFNGMQLSVKLLGLLLLATISRLTEAHPQKIPPAAVIKKAKIIVKPNRAWNQQCWRRICEFFLKWIQLFTSCRRKSFYFFAAATDTLSCMISMRNFAISAKSA